MLSRVLAIFLVCCQTKAQALDCTSHTYRLAEITDDPPGATSFFLEITPPGVSPSYVLGTFHSANPQVIEFWSRATLLMASQQIRVFVTERDLDDSPRDQMLPAQESLKTLLTDQGMLYERILAILERHHLPVSVADRFKPWFAAALINQAPAIPDRRRDKILDAYFSEAAKALGIQTRFLETFADITRYYDSNFSQSEQLQLLWEAVCNQDLLEKLIHQQTQAYATNAVAEFYRVMQQFTGAHTALSDKVIDVFVRQRNAVFWPPIWSEIKHGGAFIAVGSSHLFGPGGLLERLRSEEKIAIRDIQPQTLNVVINSADIPNLTTWAMAWMRNHVNTDVPESVFADLQITHQPLPTLRRRLCPGKACIVEATYLPETNTILFTSKLFARLMASSETPAYFFNSKTIEKTPFTMVNRRQIYADSILVRELIRHALYQKRGAKWRQQLKGHDKADLCLRKTILHWASRAQQSYLKDRGAKENAHLFTLDPRCPDV